MRLNTMAMVGGGLLLVALGGLSIALIHGNDVLAECNKAQTEQEAELGSLLRVSLASGRVLEEMIAVSAHDEDTSELDAIMPELIESAHALDAIGDDDG